MADVLEPSPEPESRSSRASWRLRRGAKALISRSGQVLLVRERHADGSPFWTLPGGGVRPEESLEGGLQRELAEELRCPATVMDERSVFWYPHSSLPETVTVYTVFECSLLSTPRPRPSEGIEACRWVAPTDQPATTLPQVRRVLADMATGDEG